MKTPQFSRVALVGAGISLAGAVGYQLLQWFFPAADALMITLSLVGISYIGWLVFSSPGATGKMTTMGIHLSGLLLIAILGESLLVLLLFLLASMWLVRSVFFHRALFSSLIDAGVTIAGGVAAIWALTTSGSWLLAFWCFFLVQSLFVFIPKFEFASTLNRASDQQDASEVKFQSAYRSAQNAIERINQSM